jgi:hypothetical protein
MSKLRLCLSNVMEIFKAVFLPNSDLSPFSAKASFQILCVFSLETVMRNDSADNLERLEAANLHCEMHYLLLSIPHTNMTTL